MDDKGMLARAADRWLRWALPTRDLDEVIGDLTEEATARRAEHGDLRAALWYARQAVALSLRYQARRHAPSASLGPAGRSSGFARNIAAAGADLRHAVRLLFRHQDSSSRGFTLLIVGTLALGIGATAAVFSLVNAVVLRPLPYAEPERLVSILEINQGEGLSHIPASAGDYLAWHEQVELFSDIAAYAFSPRAIAVADNPPERVPAAAVRAGFFELFGVSPLLGRGFIESEQEDDSRVVVLSHGLWQRLLGSADQVIGTTVQIDGAAAQVVGVMPAGFSFPDTAQLWVPMAFTQDHLEDRNWHFAHTLGRLAPGASLEAANAELAAIAAQQAEAFPDSNDSWTAQAFPLHEQLVGDTAAMLWALLGAVAFVLLIGCVNVTNLLLVRAAGRRREMAIRAALGASRLQQLRQLLAESIVITALACPAGVALAWLGMRAFTAISPVAVPGGGAVELDLAVLSFVVLLSAGASILFGLAPLATLRSDRLVTGLRTATRAIAGAESGRARALLVGGEVALAVVLVIGASLMIQSLRGLVSTDPGFRPDRLLTAQVSLPPQKYDSPERIRAFWSQLVERLEAHPGVDGAALASWLPPFSGPLLHHRIEGVHTAWTIDLPAARNRHVSSAYLSTLGVPLLRGRPIGASDRETTRRVAVVDEAFVEQIFAGQDPIGRSIRVWDDEPREIVGVVGNVKNTGLAGEAQPTSYIPLTQTPWPNQGLIVRASGDPADLVPMLRRELAELDPTLPLFGVETMQERLSRSIEDPTFQTRFIGLLSALALGLAAIGIYGLIARSVTERTAEIGVRIALGADSAGVRRMILRRALGITVIGLAIGTGAAYALRGLLADFLFGIEAIDPRLLALVAAVLIAVTVVASWVPALRAGRMDPRRALVAD